MPERLSRPRTGKGSTDTDHWVYSIPLAAIIGGITIAIFAMYFKNEKDIAMAGTGATRASEDNAQVNRQVLARLDARLAAVENTVSRVP